MQPRGEQCSPLRPAPTPDPGLDRYLQELFHHLDWQEQGTISRGEFRALCRVLGLEAGTGEAEERLKAGTEEAEERLEAGTEEAEERREAGTGEAEERLEAGTEEAEERLDAGTEEAEERLEAGTGEAEERLEAGTEKAEERREAGTEEAEERLEAGTEEAEERLEAGTGEAEERLEAGTEEAEERLSFRHFHARLCGHFISRAGTVHPQLQEQRRLRSPEMARRGGRPRPASEEQLRRLQGENRHLRQSLEELKGALQSSDARCLALQVGLYRSRTSRLAEGTATSANRRVLSQSFTVTTRCVQREVNVLQSSSEEQAPGATQRKKDLEEKLSETEKVLVYLEESNQQLLKEQAEMRRKVEDARQAVRACYSKVKDLEEQSRKVPVLQTHIDQLETELLFYRSEESKIKLRSPDKKVTTMKPNQSLVTSSHGSPTEDTPADHSAEDQMFRSVEGQAASDEEEDKWSWTPEDAMQGMLSSISCCTSGCEDRRIWKLLTDIIGSDVIDPRDVPALLVERISNLTEELTAKEQEMRDLEVLMEEIKEPFIDELERKVEDIELLRIDLQMLETERVRLSLVEEKLLDVLQLLQQLRNLEIPHQELGRVLLNTLERCREPRHDLQAQERHSDPIHHLVKGGNVKPTRKVMENLETVKCEVYCEVSSLWEKALTYTDTVSRPASHTTRGSSRTILHSVPTVYAEERQIQYSPEKAESNRDLNKLQSFQKLNSERD
ncbi:EF-hand and coiled-coil domain-containing protein 1 [Anomaloglossus baeobatrachus]|uniref:EF-hand and coiled-coil domain-containing protein 1 n=1 Tax=Anomaloglossus baeobatrachus TaxID=238106 RepID=UPI003F505080